MLHDRLEQFRVEIFFVDYVYPIIFFCEISFVKSYTENCKLKSSLVRSSIHLEYLSLRFRQFWQSDERSGRHPGDERLSNRHEATEGPIEETQGRQQAVLVNRP